MNNKNNLDDVRNKEVEKLKNRERDFVSIENEERNLKSLGRLAFILGMNGVPIVFSMLLLAGIDTFIYPLLALETLSVSELTTIITNTLENIDNKKKEKEVINYLNKVEKLGEDGIKVGQECTLRKNNKLYELEEKFDKIHKNKMIADVIGKLMLVPEIFGFIGTIFIPGKPLLGLPLSVISMLINVICKIKKYNCSKEITKIETQQTKIQDNLNLSVYYIKYNNKPKEKAKTEQAEFGKTLDLVFTADQLEATEDYLKSLEEISDLSEKPFQKIKTSTN